MRWFQSPGAGTDHPVFALLAERGVRITTAHVNSIPIAEYVLRAVLDHLQGAGQWRAAQAAAEWRPHEFREVHGTTWLVVGLGSIGARGGGAGAGVRRAPCSGPVARRRATSRSTSWCAPDAVPAALARAEVVVVCVPATSHTVGLVDDAFLGAMRPGSVLVNVGRGSLVDQDALRAARSTAACPRWRCSTSSTPSRCPPGSWLWSHPRVVADPHNSAGGDGRFGRMADLFTDNLRRWREGGPPAQRGAPGGRGGHLTPVCPGSRGCLTEQAFGTTLLSFHAARGRNDGTDHHA